LAALPDLTEKVYVYVNSIALNIQKI